jgi:predicted nucleic acid-binding protein
MVIVDSSVWVDYLRGASTPQTEWLDQNLTVRPMGITDLILCEVLQGIRDDRQFTKTHDALLKLHLFSTGGGEIALAAVKNYRTLRSRGRTVKTIDCLIATFCLERGHALLHGDRDYDVFEAELGLEIVHPNV